MNAPAPPIPQIPPRDHSEVMIDRGSHIRDFIRAYQIAEMSKTNIELTREEYGFLLRTVRVLWDTLALSDPMAITAVVTKYASFFNKV